MFINQRTWSAKFRLAVLGSMAAWLLPSTVAHAHFIWVVAEPAKAEGETRLQLSFGEGPQPAEAYLLDKVSQAQLWSIDASGKASPVKLAKDVQGDEGAWVANTKQSPAGLEAACQYGVFTRGEKSFLLQYYARYEELGQSAKQPGDRLKLSVTAAKVADGVQVRVYWQGKPVTENVQLVAAGPQGEELEAVAKDGFFFLPATAAGVYAIRARMEEAGAGKLGDDAYAQQLHYSTLTLRVPGQK